MSYVDSHAITKSPRNRGAVKPLFGLFVFISRDAVICAFLFDLQLFNAYLLFVMKLQDRAFFENVVFVFLLIASGTIMFAALSKLIKLFFV